MKVSSYSSARLDFGCRSNLPAGSSVEATNPSTLADLNQAAETNRRTCGATVFEASRQPSLGTDSGFAGFSGLRIAEQVTFTLTKPEQAGADQALQRPGTFSMKHPNFNTVRNEDCTLGRAGRP